MRKQTIENDHPAPEPSRMGVAIYPFGGMKVGDSFKTKGDTRLINSLRTAAGAYGKRHGKKYTVRVEDGGARCWRTA